VGFLDKLVSSIGGGSGPPCPDCGESLWADPPSRYECHNDACPGWGVYFDEDGVLVDPPNRGKSDVSERRCMGCDTPMKNDSVLTGEWEDGDNSGAYITCSACGCENPF
jgi:hypothetical protein